MSWTSLWVRMHSRECGSSAVTTTLRLTSHPLTGLHHGRTHHGTCGTDDGCQSQPRSSHVMGVMYDHPQSAPCSFPAVRGCRISTPPRPKGPGVGMCAFAAVRGSASPTGCRHDGPSTAPSYHEHMCAAHSSAVGCGLPQATTAVSTPGFGNRVGGTYIDRDADTGQAATTYRASRGGKEGGTALQCQHSTVGKAVDICVGHTYGTWHHGPPISDGIHSQPWAAQASGVTSPENLSWGKQSTSASTRARGGTWYMMYLRSDTQTHDSTSQRPHDEGQPSMSKTGTSFA